LAIAFSTDQVLEGIGFLLLIRRYSLVQNAFQMGLA